MGKAFQEEEAAWAKAGWHRLVCGVPDAERSLFQTERPVTEGLLHGAEEAGLPRQLWEG